MKNFEKKIEEYHLKFYGKVNKKKFIDNLHQRVHDNRVNKYSKYLLSLFLLTFSVIKMIDNKTSENLENKLGSNFYVESNIEEYPDSTYLDSLYIIDLKETFFTVGDIWNVLEFLDEIKIEEEYQYENYNYN